MGIVDAAEQALREKVVELARSFLSVPYRHQGRNTGGMDCVGMLLECFERAGAMPHQELEYYPPDWAMHREEERYLKQLEQFAHRVERAALPGDIAMYRFGRCISHGALVVEWPMVIHAYAPERKVAWGDASKGALPSRFAGIWSFWP
jgi:cell wall-associated NlpC family hydrolase